MRHILRLAMIAFAISGLLVGSKTGAYFTNDKPVEAAHFTAGTVSIAFHGEPNVPEVSSYAATKQAIWTIKNIGNNEVFLRARAIIGQTTGDIVLTSGNDLWIDGNDGYFYCKDVLPLDETVELVLNIGMNGLETAADILVDIEVEAIQSSNNAKELQWAATG
jgi:hypothetical protein